MSRLEAMFGQRPGQTAVLSAVLALVYLAAGKLGLSLAFVNPNATAVWPPSGIALAAFVVLGYRVWPGVLLGAFLVNASTSGHYPSALIIAAGNTLEGLLGAYLVNHLAHGRQAFETVRGLTRFTLLAGAISTAVSATLGTTTLALSGLAAWPDFGAIWLTWWLGDASGAVIAAPLLIVWTRRPDWLVSPARLAEGIFLFCLTIALGLLIFDYLTPLGRGNYPVAYITLPFVVWAAFRFGQHGAATTTALLAAIATWGTLGGWGPFGHRAPSEALLMLQGFMATVAITGLGVAAVMSSRRRLLAAEREARVAAEVAAQRTARLQSVTATLSQLLSAEAIGQVVVEHTVAAVRAATGLMVLMDDDGRALTIIGATACPAAANEALAAPASLEAPSPLADAVRTGQAVWLSTVADRQQRYPHWQPGQAGLLTVATASLPIVGADGRAVGALELGFAAEHSFQPAEQAFIMALSQQAGQAIERTRLYAEARQLNALLEARVTERTEQLRSQTGRLESLREAERTRMAREVHDELGGALTVIKMDIKRLARRFAEQLPDLAGQLEELLASVDQSVQIVRRIATDMRPALLDDFGLAAAIEAQVQEFERRTGIACKLRLDVDEAEPPRDIATAVFRVLQESLTNVARHAQTAQVDIHLRNRPGGVQLSVHDYGQGFDTSAAATTTSMGLVGMRERVFAVNGTLEIISSPNQGTEVQVNIPL